MKLTLDRRSCTCWQPSCESHFGSYFLGEEIKPIDCLIATEDDGLPELTFVILDRDGVDKVLVIDESNRADAVDSWQIAWEKQQDSES